MSYVSSSHLKVGDKKLLYSKLTERIYSYIEDNHVQVGDKLPGERTWAQELGVSRTSLREALRELENQGIIRVEVGRGAFLMREVDSQYVMISMAKKDFMSLFEIKIALESYILQHLSGQIKEDTLDDMEILVKDMIEIAESGVFSQEKDELFHRTLISEYPNAQMRHIIMDMIEVFEGFKEQYFNTSKTYRNIANSSFIQTLPYHLELVHGLRKKDISKVMSAYQKIVDIDMYVYGSVET